MTRDRRGFSLIELLTITVILGVLAVIAVPRVIPARDRALRASVLSDLRNLAAHQEIYFQEHSVYTGDLNRLGHGVTPGVLVTVLAAGPEGWAAEGSHAGLPGERCAVFLGSVPPGIAEPATEPGVVTCLP